VAKLEELFSQLDTAVTGLKKAKEQIKTYKQAVLKAAFSGKLKIDYGELKICSNLN
jgi:type I restriction enzyme, S subunit